MTLTRLPLATLLLSTLVSVSGESALARGRVTNPSASTDARIEALGRQADAERAAQWTSARKQETENFWLNYFQEATGRTALSYRSAGDTIHVGLAGGGQCLASKPDPCSNDFTCVEAGIVIYRHRETEKNCSM